MKTLEILQTQNIIPTDKELLIIKYYPYHMEIKTTIKNFIQTYKNNIISAFSNWLIENETLLGVETDIKEFLENFTYNFNNYAYTGATLNLRETGQVKVKIYNPFTYTNTETTIEYIHISY